MSKDSEGTIKAYVQTVHPTFIRLYRNNVGAFKKNRLIKFGLVEGSSDLIGWITINGIARFFAVEVKKATGVLSEEQAIFLNEVNKAGGVGICIWSKAEWDFFLSNLPDIPIKTYKAGKRE